MGGKRPHTGAGLLEYSHNFALVRIASLEKSRGFENPLKRSHFPGYKSNN